MSLPFEKKSKFLQKKINSPQKRELFTVDSVRIIQQQEQQQGKRLHKHRSQRKYQRR